MKHDRILYKQNRDRVSNPKLN